MLQILVVLLILLSIVLYKRHNVENFTSENEFYLPKIIWSFWDSKEIPEDVRVIHENRVAKLPDWEFHFLNSNTIHDYIDLSTLPPGFDKLKIQHKADYYRLLLLQKYGGLWLDASIIINDPSALNKLYEEAVHKKSDFTGFTLNRNPDRTKYIENWFIMAPQNNYLINEWLKEFIYAIGLGFDKYMPSAQAEGVIMVEPINPYLTQHACMQTVLQKRIHKKPKIILKDAEENMFKLQVDCNWDNKCLANKFKNNAMEIRKLPFIKLRGADRGFDIKEYFVIEGFGMRVGYAA